MATTRWLLAVAGLSVLGLGGCGDEVAGLTPDTNPVVVTTASSVASLVPADGTLAFSVPEAVAAADGSIVYAVRRDQLGTTTLTGLDPATGEVVRTQRLRGELWIRAVSPDGRSVALVGTPPAAAAEPYPVVPRERTEVTIAEPAVGTARRTAVEGNVEPEGFTADRLSLFAVEFHPPMAPDRYRVRRVDLASGELHDVFSADKELQEDMKGSARTQAWSADGYRLYTLYTLDDADAGGHGAGDVHAFVHVLDLQGEWAHCIDLPHGIGLGEDDAALAVSPDGGRLFVADRGAGALVEVDTEALRVTRSVELPVSESPTVTAAVDGPGRVLVALGSELHVLDAESLRPVRTTDIDRPITALRATEGWVVAASGSQLAVLDRAGKVTSWLSLPALVTGVGTGKTMDPGRQQLECAC